MRCLFVVFVYISIGLGVLYTVLKQLFVLLPWSPPTATPLGPSGPSHLVLECWGTLSSHCFPMGHVLTRALDLLPVLDSLTHWTELPVLPPSQTLCGWNQPLFFSSPGPGCPHCWSLCLTICSQATGCSWIYPKMEPDTKRQSHGSEPWMCFYFQSLASLVFRVKKDKLQVQGGGYIFSLSFQTVFSCLPRGFSKWDVPLLILLLSCFFVEHKL